MSSTADSRGQGAIMRPNDTMLEEVISVRRVTKVVKGGRNLGFSVHVVVGDGAGMVGIGDGKGKEVSFAVSKAIKRAKRSLFPINMQGKTIPHNITAKFGASKVQLWSAAKGTGVIAGGAMRSVLSVLGVKDILAKSIGSSNSVNVAKATIAALCKLKSIGQVSKFRGVGLPFLAGEKKDARISESNKA